MTTQEYGPSVVSEWTVPLMFESLSACDGCCQAAFGMNVFSVALEAAIRAVRIDRPFDRDREGGDAAPIPISGRNRDGKGVIRHAPSCPPSAVFRFQSKLDCAGSG